MYIESSSMKPEELHTLKYRCSCGSSNYTFYDKFVGHIWHNVASGVVDANNADDQDADHVRSCHIVCSECNKRTNLKNIGSLREFIERDSKVKPSQNKIEENDNEFCDCKDNHDREELSFNQCKSCSKVVSAF